MATRCVLLADDDARSFPLPSGHTYRVTSPPEYAIVTPALARELRAALERFAVDAGYSATRPVGIFFRPGIFGHHRDHRAADIYAVDGIAIDAWKRRGESARACAAAARTPLERRAILEAERRSNLGWRLYKALQCYGRWSQPYGYPIQLFGPWTRDEGPWRYISDRLACAHRDHIHVAK